MVITPTASCCGCPPDSIYYGQCDFTGCLHWSSYGAPPPITSYLPTLCKQPRLPPVEATTVSDEAEIAEGLQPENTTKSALNTFKQWSNERAIILTSEVLAELCKYLSFHIKNSEKYPPATLHQLLLDILNT